MDASGKAPKYETLQEVVDQLRFAGYADELGHQIEHNAAFVALEKMAADQGGHYKPRMWDVVRIEYTDVAFTADILEITSVLPDCIYGREGPNRVPFQIFNHHIKSIKPILTQQLTTKLAQFMDRLVEVRKAHEVQGNDGNWNYDPYMTGIYNGLEFALATMEGRSPHYRSSSGRWVVPIVNDEWDLENGEFKPGGTE